MMNHQSYRGNSFRRLFSKSTAVTPAMGANTIPRQGASKFYQPHSSNAQRKCVMQGWLKRQSVGIMKSWQTRWFVLEGEVLCYYSSKDDAKSLVGQICLLGLSLMELPYSDQQKYLFELYYDSPTNGRVSHMLCAESEEERKEWSKHIKQVLYGSKGGAIFGRPLEVTLNYERRTNKDRKVPELVEMCVKFLQNNGLESEGIFRLPGRTALVKQLRNAFDVGERPVMDLSSVDVHSAASLLKAYLRELPGPLIPVSFYDSVMHIVTRELDLYPDESVERMAKIISTLPQANYNLLHYLCCFLHEVGQMSEVNRMTDMNLATVFCQSFIEPEDDDPALLMGTSDNRSKAAFLFINKVDKIFIGNIEETSDTFQQDEQQNGLDTMNFDPEDYDNAVGFHKNNEDESVQVCLRGRCLETQLGNDLDSDTVETNSHDWMFVEKDLFGECSVSEDIGSVSRISQIRGHRRSASVGHEPVESLVSEEFENVVTSAEPFDFSPEVERLLKSDPLQWSHDELVKQFVHLRELFDKQHQASEKLQQLLIESDKRHRKKLQLMAVRLDDERTATSEAVNRIVQIQADLEKYHLKYGPL